MKEISINTYWLPFDESLNLMPNPAPFHKENKDISMMNALDFSMPEGTPLYAARGGTVTETKSNSKIGGLEKSLLQRANYIFIRHEHGECTLYVHLKHKGVTVREGQRVKTGWEYEVYRLGRYKINGKIVTLKTPL